MDFKKKILVITFYTICVSSSGWLAVSKLGREVKIEEQEKKVPESENYFRQIQLFLLKHKKPHLSLHASELIHQTLLGKSTFLNPMGIFFNNNQDPVNYSADRGLMWQGQDRFFLDGFVRMKTVNSEFLADWIEYSWLQKEIHAKGNVDSSTLMENGEDTIFVKSFEAYFWPNKKVAKYLGKTKGKVLRKRAYEQGIEFKAEELTATETDQKIDMIGDVWIKKEGMTATSQKGEVFLENYNKKLKYFVLYDDVKLVELLTVKNVSGLESKQERRGFGERLEGIMIEDKMILTGAPKVVQGSDVIKGNVIVLRENNDVVEVDDANSNFKIQE